MSKQFIVVSYDISDDKRRRKIMKAMEDFGTRVQYSVFECRLEAKELLALKKRLRPHVREKQDSVRFYFLCIEDVGRTEIMGGGQVTQDKPFYMR
jgi:CRISPR-associated protein Cas2